MMSNVKWYRIIDDCVWNHAIINNITPTKQHFFETQTLYLILHGINF